MGRNNAVLIRRVEKLRKDGRVNTPEWEYAVQEAEASQEACPHPEHARRTRGGYYYCIDCGKVLRYPGQKMLGLPWWERLV